MSGREEDKLSLRKENQITFKSGKTTQIATKY
jgi:hypothetical protein